MPKMNGLQVMTKDLRRTIQKAGYKTGLLISMCVLNDCFDFSDEELQEFIDRCDELLLSMEKAEGDDWRRINYELKVRTGIDIVYETDERKMVRNEDR